MSQQNDDVIKGFRFHISPRSDVPESVKQHDNEFHPGPQEALPDYGDPRYGSWELELKSWGEIIAETK